MVPRFLGWYANNEFTKERIKKTLKQRPEGHLHINPETDKPYITMREELVRVLKSVNEELNKNNKRCINKPTRHHLLRHSFGTNAIITKTFTLVELKEFMGHSSINTTMIYVTLAAELLKDPASKFGDYTVTPK